MGLMEVLFPAGFDLAEMPAEVTAAVPCWIRKGRGMHLVMWGENGPVTVLLMPGEHVAKPQAVMAVSLAGVLVPTDWGSMVVVSHAGDDVESLVYSLLKDVLWKGKPSSISF